MTIVLSGNYIENGDAGRFEVEAGDVLVHAPFEAHLDILPLTGAELINLPLQADVFIGRHMRVDDADEIVRHSERDLVEAANLALCRAKPHRPLSDWVSSLAGELNRGIVEPLGSWAERQGLSPWDISRHFTRTFGTTPKCFAAEARARRAWKEIRLSDAPLVDIAYQLGFADQAHMTRAVKKLTGAPPSHWRPIQG